jgi:hypothetical protein
MKKLVILSLLTTLLFAQNPRVYSALGDVVYDNVQSIEKLKYISEFSTEKEKIEEYVKDVNETKKDGFAVESKNESINKSSYLDKLRELSKMNDYFKRAVRENFKSSIQNENSELFSKIVNSGLIDINSYKQDIKTYYSKHSDEIDPSGVIQNILDEDASLKIQSKAKLIDKNIQEDNIKRIRAKDKIQQEAIQKSLEKEVNKKKQEIREYQKKELLGN